MTKLSPGHYHLVGGAGVGMSALAQALLAAGCRVTASDRYVDSGAEPEVVRKLRRAGILFAPQDGAAVGPDTRAVVASAAVEDDNADLDAARARGVPILHRAAALAALVGDDPCVAIAGTSGKTTVTGMVGWILAECGLDPNVVNGGCLVNWLDDDTVGNARAGAGGLWVIEADESDRSLLRFTPDWAVVTNVSADHFDLAETQALFDRFVAGVAKGVVGPIDAATAERLVVGERFPEGGGFELADIEFYVPLPGRHNAENAWQAVRLCLELGVDPERARDALASFRGIHRRLEIVATDPVAVVDDYAHNPAKIEAAWTAVAAGGRRVVGLWRPHGYGPLRTMRAELCDLFARLCAAGDRLLLLPVYDAGGTARRDVSSDDLAADLRANGVDAAVVGDYEAAIAAVAADPGEVVVVMGARDPELPALARRISRSLEPRSKPRE